MDFKAFKEKVMSDKAFAAEFTDDDLDKIAGGTAILGSYWLIAEY